MISIKDCWIVWSFDLNWKKAVTLIRHWHLRNSVLPPWIPQHLKPLESWLQGIKYGYATFEWGRNISQCQFHQFSFLLAIQMQKILLVSGRYKIPWRWQWFYYYILVSSLRFSTAQPLIHALISRTTLHYCHYPETQWISPIFQVVCLYTGHARYFVQWEPLLAS